MTDKENSVALTPETNPGKAGVEEGYVLLEGPGAVAVTMTVEAAEATAHSLLAAVREARAAGA